MLGVEIKQEDKMYLCKFKNYRTMLEFFDRKRPSQAVFSYDGEELTASFPVSAYKVRGDENIIKKEK